MSRSTPFACALALLTLQLIGCGPEDLELTDDPTLDLWCADMLCESWQTTGTFDRVGTWHKADLAVELGSRGASLSQTIERPGASFTCVEVQVMGKWTDSTKLVLAFDWDDDGREDWSQRLPAVDWQRWEAMPDSIRSFTKFRVTARREGSERAVIAELRVRKVPECTDELNLDELLDDYECIDDDCPGGRCVAIDNRGVIIDSEDGFLVGKTHLLMDREPVFTADVRNLLRIAGVELMRLPARSPNLNASAEGFVLSIKSECLDWLVLLGEAHLRLAVREYLAHTIPSDPTKDSLGVS